MNSVEKLAALSKAAAVEMQSLDAEVKNQALQSMASALRCNMASLLAANAQDCSDAEAAVASGSLSLSLYKRLVLNEAKIEDMALGLESIALLPDPVGVVQEKLLLDDGLYLTKITCPIGLLGIIFESRPDVVPQVMGLALKSGNAVIFKGGSEAGRTNAVLFDLLYDAALAAGVPSKFAGLVKTREEVSEILRLDSYFSLLIPRGSNELVRSIMDNTRIPVLGHADGICHMYIDRDADPEKAVRLIVDAKTQYPAVCNAIENLLIDRQILTGMLPGIVRAMRDKNVELRGDDTVCAADESIQHASDEDWDTEYNDLVLSIAAVDGVSSAVDFINLHGSGHTDAIVTENRETAKYFQEYVDSATVAVNASTRFADGFRYGKGAEIGISTNKTHARGPVGLEGLVIYKYLLSGDGHVVADYSGADARSFKHTRLN